jgi:hypothetical protein
MQASRSSAHLPLIIVALVLISASAASAQSLSGFTYNGLVYTSYQANEYLETPQGAQGAAAMRATGANYASVVVTQYVQTYTSNTIAPETPNTPGYNVSTDPLSPTDSAVAAAIQNLQAQGLTVFLKPQVDSVDGTFRGDFAPSNVAAWFASYQTFILHYAQIASQNKVGGLIIGTELVSLTKTAYESYWDNIIAQIRSAYPGLTLAYGANATYATDEFTTVSFWDKVDIIGVDGYFPLTDQTDPTVAQLVAAWTNNKSGLNIVAALKSLQSQYNKPLIFTELGYVSAPGTNEAPYASAAAGAAYDPTEQDNCYEAFFEVFSQESSWMKGVFWWAWTVSPPGTNDTGYTPQDKPAAEATLAKWYGSTSQGFTLAPATSVLTVGQGLSANDTISVTNLGGFIGAVTLAASGLPSGVNASFVAQSVPDTQVMTLTAANGATGGTVSVTITGTSGSLAASTAVALTVQASASQTITFDNPGPQIVGTPLTLSAAASSGLAVSFVSTTLGVCTIDNTIASFVGAGTCTITAAQGGNSVYAPATSVSQSFAVTTLTPVPVPATADVIVSQLDWLSVLNGNAYASGNPDGSSFAVNSNGDIVEANTNNLTLFHAKTGTATTLGAWSSASAVAIDANNNIYVGNLYGPLDIIVKVPYVGGATNGGYAAFATPSSSTPVCTSSSMTECSLPNLGSVNPGAMAFDAAGDLFWVTAGSGTTSGNSIYECSVACLAGTASEVQIYQEPTASTPPSSSSGQLLAGGLAIDPIGNIFFTDSSIYVNQSTYAITSFYSNLKELPTTKGVGYGGQTTGYAASPTVLYTVIPGSIGQFDNQLDGVAVNATTGTVYFADQSDGVFAFPNAGSAIPVANGQPTAMYTVSKQGAKTLAIDGQGNLYFAAYSNVLSASGGDTLGQITLNAVTVPTSPVGTAVSPSATLNPVTTLLNDSGCSSNPTPSVTFDAGMSSTATAAANTNGTCSSTLSGGSAFATAISFTPTAGGTATVSLSATDQAGNSGTVTITGAGQTSISAQTITFSNPGPQVVGTPLTLSATASSGLTVAFASTTTSVCTVSNNVATFLTAGTCTIDANQAGNASFSAAPQVQQSFAVSAAPSFTVAPTASILSVIEGSSVTDTIAVTGANGFAGSVTLAASNLPSGVSASFATNPTTGSSVLTLTASSTATTGAATIAISGTSGNLSASTSIVLTVNPAPAFTIAPSASALSIAQGNSATDTITVSGSNGFNGSVTLAATGLPSGVTATFATNPAVGSSVLTLAASSMSATGTSTVTVTGTSGSLTASTTIALTVNAPPGFTLAPSTPTVSVAPGSSTNDTITISGSGGFVGTVSLSAAITSSPQGAQDLPTLSFGSTNPVTVTSAGGTATLTISTTAATTAASDRPVRPANYWKIGGGMLACLCSFLTPRRRRRWPVILGTFAILCALTSGLMGCGGGGSPGPPVGKSGTTPGSYAITVTATSGTVTATVPVTVTVQ